MLSTENILKFLLIIMIIYLTWKCFNFSEFFADIMENKKVLFKSDEETYILITFEDMKEEYQKKIIDILLKDTEFMNMQENINDVNNKIFYKVPLFLVKEADVVKYTNNNTLSLNLNKESSENGKDIYVFMPKVNNELKNDKYIRTNSKFDFMFYSKANGAFLKSYIDGLVKNKYLKENIIPGENVYGISDSGTKSLNISII